MFYYYIFHFFTLPSTLLLFIKYVFVPYTVCNFLSSVSFLMLCYKIRRDDLAAKSRIRDCHRHRFGTNYHHVFFLLFLDFFTGTSSSDDDDESSLSSSLSSSSFLFFISSLFSLLS